MPFQKGQSGNPKGKRKGEVCKFTTLKATFLNAFARSGGEDALVEWIKASNHNRATFYHWITRMLPADVNVSGENGGPIKATLTIEIVDPLQPK